MSEPARENLECLNVEADSPKVVEIVIGDHAIISGVLNTGSVLSIRARTGAGAGPIHVKADPLAPSRPPDAQPHRSET